MEEDEEDTVAKLPDEKLSPVVINIDNDSGVNYSTVWKGAIWYDFQGHTNIPAQPLDRPVIGSNWFKSV